jgi:hypothetical protein
MKSTLDIQYGYYKGTGSRIGLTGYETLWVWEGFHRMKDESNAGGIVVRQKHTHYRVKDSDSQRYGAPIALYIELSEIDVIDYINGEKEDSFKLVFRNQDGLFLKTPDIKIAKMIQIKIIGIL